MSNDVKKEAAGGRDAGGTGASWTGASGRNAGGTGASGTGASGRDANRRGAGKGKNALFAIAAALIMIGVGIWYYFYAEGLKYFVTDNAKVTANMYQVTSPAAGKLVRFNVRPGNYVEEDEIIGRIENGPYLRAPVGGQIVKVSAAKNQTVTQGASVAIIADTDSIYIGANIEETDILKIKKGQSATVLLDSYRGKQFSACVSEVDNTTQNALTGNLMSFSTSGTYTKVTQLIPIKISVNDDVNLDEIIGTNATVRIRIKE